ncbi:WxL domain-containing protein [Candidatus Enterococcus ikei]|uniref:WxL domain-containing protein n=1 Tax=Candidatus Enterococcus ikei TaxID=2815326 RepID=A0ABS3H131_9ENTE|nr:WxL domain-containing protein [Enterococcus sp. DIV0869a]MBO0441225.1 WxL domain-containing protein [Enterococcus sp. DIV0869a]
MKQQLLKATASAVLLLSAVSMFLFEAEATSGWLEQSGTVTVEGNSISPPIDPENPEEVVDPGESPSTEGTLRIDFVSTLHFGQADLAASNRIYTAFAQQFLGDTDPRGSFIQVTDQRTQSTGWTLQVKQNYQFRNATIQEASEQELNGAVLSLDKSWANSSGTSQAPKVTSDPIDLQTMDTAYELATATLGNGRGVWIIAFGASQTNSNQIENTLTPALDSSGQAIMDEFSGKAAYRNSAISLTVPNATKIHPLQYTTELTWILAELP